MRKYDVISALSEETSKRVTRNEESWKKYLNTASRLYKHPFKDQLLIYAQRPDATACASIEIWNEKMHCWVNKGAKGIALLDEEGSPYTGLRYVFDISDVHKARRIGRFHNLWEMREEHQEAVLNRLEGIYGDTDKEAGFVDRIREIVRWYVRPSGSKFHLHRLLRRALSALRQPKGETTIPLRKLRLLPFSELCVQTKAKVRLLSAHKVCPCAPLPCRQNVGVAYG